MIICSGARPCSLACGLVLMAGLLNAAPTSAVFEVPESLRTLGEQTRVSWSNSDGPAAQRYADQFAERILTWLPVVMRDVDTKQLVAALQAVAPVIESDVHPSWSLAEAVGPVTSPLAVRVATWRRGERELSVFSVRVVVQATRNANPYLRSTPPLLIAKEGGHPLSPSSLSNWDTEFVTNESYMTIGFIEAEGASPQPWPDVLIGRGPGGSAMVVDFIQLHRGDGEWQRLYDEDFAHIQRFELEEHSARLKVGHVIDIENAGEQETVLQLRHGDRPKLVKAKYLGDPTPLPPPHPHSDSHSQQERPLGSLVSHSAGVRNDGILGRMTTGI